MTTNARAFHLPRVPPRHCRWCAAPITRGRKDRTWHDGREDEPRCFYEYQLHTRREIQFAFIAARDGEKCWDCDAAPMRWHHGGRCYMNGYLCNLVSRVTALELEHEVPLWRTTHLVWEDRRAYFGPKNLRLRCSACHAPKTKDEASKRAKEKRQAKLRVGAERKEPRRKIQGRGFQPGHRPMPSRPFEKRKPR
jgi:hypothetical protein